MIHTISIPVTDWTLPASCGSIGYEGDVQVTRLEFTGAETGYDYKLDFQRIGCREKCVLDLQREGDILYVDFDAHVDIPAGTYHIQLRTLGDTVVHTNKSTLLVRSSINALRGFHPIRLTEAAQIEARLTAMKHDVEGLSADVQTQAAAAEQAVETCADKVTAAQGAAAAAQNAQSDAEQAKAGAETAQTAAEQAASQAESQAQEAAKQAKEAAAQAQKAADYTNAYSKSEMDQLLAQCALVPSVRQSGHLFHREKGIGEDAQDPLLTGGISQAYVPSPSYTVKMYGVMAGTTIRVVKKNLFDPATAAIRSTSATLTQTDGQIKLSTSANTASALAVLPVARLGQLAGKTVTLSYTLSDKSDSIPTVDVDLVRCGNAGTSTLWLSDENGTATLDASRLETGEWLAIYIKLTGDTTIPAGESITLDQIQVELGDTATEYEPYQVCGSLTVPCNLYKCGEYMDSWNPLTGEVTHQVGLWIGDGKTSGKKFTSLSGGQNNLAMASISNCMNIDLLETGPRCTNFAYNVSAHSGSGTDVAFCLSNGKLYCRFGANSKTNTLALANTWLTSKLMSATYPLAIPTTETYDPQTLTLPSGVCTLLADGDGQPDCVALSYQQDLETYVQTTVDQRMSGLVQRVTSLEARVNQLEK